MADTAAKSRSLKRPAATPSNTRKLKKPGFFNAKSGFDMPFFVIVLVLVVVGLIVMFSASYPSAYYYKGNSYAYFLPQLRSVIIGIGAMIVVSFVDYRQLRRFAYMVFAISVVLLIAVLIVPSEGDVKRWMTIGIQFQPSEIAKFATILILACWTSTHSESMDKFKEGVLLPGVFVAVTCALLMLEPHYSCIAIILILTMVMLFLSGVKGIYFIVGIGAVAALFAILYSTGALAGYLEKKFSGWGTALTYINDDQWQNQTWQTRNSLYAIGSGGLLGLGPGQSRQKHLFLPEPQNDFIFAIVCEELGFIGALVILLAFAYLVYRGIRVCMRAPDIFGRLLGTGLCAQIGLQVILNVLVITDCLPNTGISFPFFSYGGTSMIMLLMQMGVVLSITRSARAEKM